MSGTGCICDNYHTIFSSSPVIFSCYFFNMVLLKSIQFLSRQNAWSNTELLWIYWNINWKTQFPSHIFQSGTHEKKNKLASEHLYLQKCNKIYKKKSARWLFFFSPSMFKQGVLYLWRVLYIHPTFYFFFLKFWAISSSSQEGIQPFLFSFILFLWSVCFF